MNNKKGFGEMASALQMLTNEAQRRFGKCKGIREIKVIGSSKKCWYGEVMQQDIRLKMSVRKDGRRHRQTMTFLDIQQEVIDNFDITIKEHSTCYGRMHAHVKTRTVCKWHPKKSIQATFDLFHEIGHIETTKSRMRRCESEYYATLFAINLCEEYGLKIPEKTLKNYQEYIFRELDRGIRRGGKNYPSREELLLPSMNIEDFRKKDILADRPHILMNVRWTSCFEMEDVIDEVCDALHRMKVVTLQSEDLNDSDWEWIQECIINSMWDDAWRLTIQDLEDGGMKVWLNEELRGE